MSKILFIGAGASFGAREKMEKCPPLGAKLCEWLSFSCNNLLSQTSCIDLRSTIRDGLEILNNHQSDTNYEQLISKLGREERLNLQRLLMITFTDLTEKHIKNQIDIGFKNHPDGYDKLIQKLAFDNTWSVISLNYDILFEEALRRNCIEFYYPFFPFQFGDDQSKLKGIRIFKPHGSINFFAHSNPTFTYGKSIPESKIDQIDFTFDEAGNCIPNYSIAMSALPKAENVLHRAISNVSFPVQANYSKGKSIDVNDKTLNNVRTLAINTCKESNEILTVGVRPILDQNDDHFVSTILKTPISRFTYISPDQGECDLIKSLHSHAITECKTLLSFLE